MRRWLSSLGQNDRRVAGCLKLGGLVATLLVCSLAPAFLSAAEPTKVLLVGHKPDHPPGTHTYLPTARMLAAQLEKHPGVQAVVSDGWPTDPKVLQGVNVLVLYSSSGAELLLLDKPYRPQVEKLLDGGAGLVTIHWATAVRKANLDRLGPTWQKYLGGYWISNVGLAMGRSELRQLEPQHPICRGWKPFTVYDEYYLNPTLGRAKPLLAVQVKGKPLVVAWYYVRPDGARSFATTLGHFGRNFDIPQFRRMVLNGILWAAGREVPAEGAKVD